MRVFFFKIQFYWIVASDPYAPGGMLHVNTFIALVKERD